MTKEPPDGDLVRLARDGDTVAFRLLVERHQPAARARARSLCGNPSDVDDVVQESFLRAFIGLDGLRDPDRFGGWLGGIVANVCRGLRRHAPVALLPDWPEPLHPAAGHGLPSAEDLDRAQAVRAAVARLPAGQRRAVALHYYADLPPGQIATPAGAARASLHKARLTLRAYLTEHRPDLVRRTPMTTVRVARFESRIPPGPSPIGFPSDVLVLADDAGRRELPVWSMQRRRLGPLLASRAADREPGETVDQLAVRLLRAAGTRVTGVDIDELGPEVTAARIALSGPEGTRHVTARVEDGLTVAVAAGAPVRVADPVMDRLAIPLPRDGGPLPLPEPAAALAVLSPHGRPRYEPRNLTFADGLDHWRLGGSFTGHPSHAHWQDYACAAKDGVAVLSATVPRPAGFAFLGQEMFADDYLGATLTLGGEVRVRDAGEAGRAGLFLRMVRGAGPLQSITERAAASDPDNTIVTVPGDRDWASHLVTAPVPADTSTIVFGVFLAGGGRIELTRAELTG